MIPAYLTEEELQSIIDKAIVEDLGDGDHTTLAVLPSSQKAIAHIICKSEGIFAGTELAVWIFHKFDSSLEVSILVTDGSQVNFGDRILRITGNAQAIFRPKDWYLISCSE